MAEPRTPREVTSREKTTRAVYAPPSLLPEPAPDAHYVYRWVATHVMGVADPTNVSKKLREGWEPVKASDHPELMLFGDKNGNVEIGGLMLCKMVKEMAKSRDEYYQDQTKQQASSIDNNFMRESDARMPLFAEKSTSVGRSRFGNGN